MNVPRKSSTKKVACHSPGAALTELSGCHQQTQMQAINQRRVARCQLPRINVLITTLANNVGEQGFQLLGRQAVHG